MAIIAAYKLKNGFGHSMWPLKNKLSTHEYDEI
jgi:hypothetical protein